MTYRILDDTNITGDVAVTGDLAVDGYFDVTDSSGSPMFGNQIYRNVGYSPGQTFYVRVDGYDDTGDGLTPATAWRQPQRALDEIPDNATGIFDIDCGPGDFEAPIFRRQLPPTLYDLIITVWGDRGSPDIAIGSGLTWSEISKGRRRAAVGAYGATITDNSHWIEILNPGFTTISRPAANSTTPNLDAPMTFDIGQTVVAVHPFATTFSDPASTASFKIGFVGSVFRTGPGTSEFGVSFAGIDFTPSFGNRYVNCILAGCRIGTGFDKLGNIDGAIVTKGTMSLIGHGGFQNCILKHDLNINGTLSISGIQRAGKIATNVNFESPGAGAAITINGLSLEGEGIEIGTSTLRIDGDIECVASTKFVSATDGSNIINPNDSTVSGTCTGTPVVLLENSTIEGVAGNFTVTNSTTAAEEIQVGTGATPVLFSALPITDATTLCKAT